MNLRIEMNTSKNDIPFNTEESPLESANICYRNHFFGVSFVIFASKMEIDGESDVDYVYEDDKVKVGEIDAYIIDEELCINDGINAVYLADDEAAILADMVNSMQNSKAYNEICEDLDWKPLLSACLTRLYVYPEFRNKGIGTYLFNNLGYILKTFLNKDIHAVVTPPLELYVDEEPTPEENAAMRKKVSKYLNHAGYKKVGTIGCYMNNYAVVPLD